ncbi:MAG: leucine-rich repeat domain-containing protein, partial [Candidatus Paceibacterota bacterium]
LPLEIGQLSSLQEMYLGHSQLTSLPPEIGHLSSLQWLTLGSNRLTSLPPEIGQLSPLEWLALDHNQLTSLPPEIGHLSSLRELHLGRNCLIRIPPLSSTATIRGGSEEDQRLPTALEATTWEECEIVVDTDTESSSSGFSLDFYTDDASSSSSIAITDRRTLAKRWPFFRHLLSAGLSEAHEGSADLSPYFSTRLGQCLVDYFEERPIRVSLLQPQDCLDFVEHANYFGLGDVLLFHFCIAKLKKDGAVRRPTSIHG